MHEKSYQERLKEQSATRPRALDWPTLYSEDKNGTIRQWTVHVEGDEVITSHGVYMGEIQESAKTCTAKNIGKSNATTPHEQACLEATSAHAKRLRMKYSLSMEGARSFRLRPMLAKKYDPSQEFGKIIMQPKLDGMRCLAIYDRESRIVTLMSRGGKEFAHLAELKEELKLAFEKMMEANAPDLVLDGELYVHNTPFQTVSSWIKADHPQSKTIQFHAYDAFLKNDLDAGYMERWRHMDHFVKFAELAWGKDTRVRQVATYHVEGFPDAIMQLHKEIVAEGFEGSMIRLDGEPYEFGHRSNSLLKVKDFDDAEFKILAINEGRGKFKGLAIFKCALEGQLTFDTVIKGNEYERAQYYKNREQYIGKMLTVRYQGKSTSGIPRFPVGIAIREEGE